MAEIKRLRIVIRGVVQGVGFRPFVYRLANTLSLPGWIINSSQGVFIEVEGEEKELEKFQLRLQSDKPSLSYVQSFETSHLYPVGFETFEIRKSEDFGEKTVLVLPDVATCPECLKDISDPQNRRYNYPFTNCTRCGPRYSIVRSLPYDRPNTSMSGFPMCSRCLEEYENPMDRRFHAQPNACPDCGPQLSFWNRRGETLFTGHNALLESAAKLRQGRVCAVKGLGGFHLMVDARENKAIELLRDRKGRGEKPLAVMFPTLSDIKKACHVSLLEERLLTSPESPIVLLSKREDSSTNQIANLVAPGNPYLGVMLPYTPLHHILMRETAFPLVATSGNLSNEPICVDEREAARRLKGIADFFLVHNRPIIRPVDDSLVRIILGREMVLRRSRGYAPLPIDLKKSYKTVLALGAHQKNSIALQVNENAVISQHIGDLETEEAFGAFQRCVRDMSELYDSKPETIACDLHPDYLSTQYANRQSIPVRCVQHHFAHIASCMAENELEGEVLGVSWDGTGYGTDGTIWGGEFLLVSDTSFERVSCIRPFPLPGGVQAIKEPRRSALGALFELYGSKIFETETPWPLDSFTPNELKLLKQMLEKGINSPKTSSMGRLFDAVSALVGLRQVSSFEGQGAMELEFLATGVESEERYPFELSSYIDWAPMIDAISVDLEREVNRGLISTKFHNTLAEMVVSVARESRQKRVVLSGGCFQNKSLTERVVNRLSSEGFSPYWHQRVPPNDGGIALGQLYATRSVPR